MAVTNLWHVLNLRESPFFQDPLDPGGGHYPIDLFVGRRGEAELILRGIGGAPHSRHAIQGPPGVGKTTLVQFIKAQVAGDGYLAEADAIAVTSATTADDLLLKILRSVHDLLVARDSTLANLPVMQDVRQVLDVDRSRTFSLSGAIGGFGAAFGAVPQRHTGPGALTVQPARLLRELSEVATRRLEAPGILIHLNLIHLNNRENITETDQARAARIVRDLRDTGLMYPGFHYLLAGTDDAVRTVVASQEQLRSVFSNPGSLRPLGQPEVEELLERRYEYLRVFDDRPWHPPVTREALRALYALFEGNLRGTLHALDEAARELVGSQADPTAPMDLERMGPVLHAVYRRKLDADLTPAQVEQVRRVAEHGLDVVLTQAEMAQEWGLRQAATSLAVGELKRSGYLVESDAPAPRGRRGRPAQRYSLTGQARLAFGGLVG